MPLRPSSDLPADLEALKRALAGGRPDAPLLPAGGTGRPQPLALLQRTDLGGADFQGADLSFALLQGALLQGSDLRGACLYGANMEGTDLRDADLSGCDLRDTDLRDAMLDGTLLHDALLP